MLTVVKFHGYRGFESYSMTGLAQVNLLVGRNNSGKTSLLEGLRILATGGDPEVLAEVARDRGETITTSAELPALIDPSHFFFGHALTTESSFRIESEGEFGTVAVRVIDIEPKSASSEVVRSGPAIQIKRSSSQGDAVHLMSLTRSGGVDVASGTTSGPRRLLPTRRPSSSRARFVGTQSWETWTIAQAWDEVTVSGKEDEVTQALQILEPGVRSVRMLGGVIAAGHSASRAGFVVGLEGRERRIPIGSMGDGVRRLLVLAAAVACAKGGALFIDEVDTGLHYSVLHNVWRVLIERAIASDVQIFATTHSWDCIDGLAKVAQAHGELASRIAVHKIDPRLSHSVPFAGASLYNMLRHDVDPR